MAKLKQTDSGCDSMDDFIRAEPTHCAFCQKGRRRLEHCRKIKAKHCQMCHRKICGR